VNNNNSIVPSQVTLTRAQLRSAAESAAASPKVRIDAAMTLLDGFGATARNCRIVKRIISEFEEYDGASSPRTNKLIRQRVTELKGKLKAALATTPTDEPDDADDAEASTPTGIDLLPPDHADEYWDAVIHGKTRRVMLGIALGLPAFLPFTRPEAIAAIASHLHCAKSQLEFRQGRTDPPWQFDWIPYAVVRNEEEKGEPS
jgi:hypothetical protein